MRQSGAQSAILQTNFRGDIAGAIHVGFKHATGQEVKSARLHLNLKNIPRLIQNHDVNLTVLLLSTRAARSVSTVEQEACVGQTPVSSYREPLNFSMTSRQLLPGTAPKARANSFEWLMSPSAKVLSASPMRALM